MRLVSEYLIQEVTYKYETEKEKGIHKKHMISKGFKETSYLLINGNPLVARYELKQLKDRIARL